MVQQASICPTPQKRSASATRGGSGACRDPSLHVAMYEFSDQAALDRAMGGGALKTLVAEFDRCWPEVTRTRELLVLAEEFAAG